MSPTTLKGEIACAKFDLRALEKGAISSRPQTECAYDRMLDWEGKIYRVQIKYAGSDSHNAEGAARCSLERIGHNHREGVRYSNDIDVIVAYVSKVDKLCWFDRKSFENKRNIFIRYHPSKSGRKKGCHFLQDCEW